MRRRPSKLQINVQELDLDQIVSNLERMIVDTEKKVERIISRGPTPRNLKTTYQKNVPDANGRRIEDIRKTLRGARKSLHVLLRRQRGLVKEVKVSPKKKKEFSTISTQTINDYGNMAESTTQTINLPIEPVVTTASTPTQTVSTHQLASTEKKQYRQENTHEHAMTIKSKHDTMNSNNIQNSGSKPDIVASSSPNIAATSKYQQQVAKTPPTRKAPARTWKTKALLKIRKALYKKIIKDAPDVDAVFYDEYKKVNDNLKQLGIRPKLLPSHSRRSIDVATAATNGATDDFQTNASHVTHTNINQFLFHDTETKSKQNTANRINHGNNSRRRRVTPTKQKLASIKEHQNAKSIEYLFAKILAGPLSPQTPHSSTTTTTTTTTTRCDGEGEQVIQDIDEDLDDDQLIINRLVNISSASGASSIDFSHHDLATPPHTPNRNKTLFATKTPPSSGRKRNRFYPLSKSPKAKRIFNPVSPILKAKGEYDDDIGAILFNNIEF